MDKMTRRDVMKTGFAAAALGASALFFSLREFLETDTPK